MKKYKTTFTKEELQNILNANSGKAISIVEDEKKWSAFKAKFESFLRKMKKFPVLGSVIDDVICMTELVESYVKKEYIAIPKGTIISIVAMLIYLLSPIDLIPDAVPAIGYIDDVALVLLVLSFGVDHDLDRYRAVVTKNRTNALNTFEELLAHEIQVYIGDMFLTAAIWDKKKTIKLLVSEKQKAEMPIECMVKEINVPLKQYAEYEIEKEVDILDSLNRVVSSSSIQWMDEAEHKIHFEPDFTERWNNYIIQEVE